MIGVSNEFGGTSSHAPMSIWNVRVSVVVVMATLRGANEASASSYVDYTSSTA